MKKLTLLTKTFSLVLAASILFSSCASTTTIKTMPDGAKLYIDDEPVGTTPYRYTDTKIVGSVTEIKIEKEGYETFNTVLVRDEQVDAGAIVGGIFFLFPFLWTMKYKPVHTYELKAIPGYYVTKPGKTDSALLTKAEKLRELKKLLDDKVITKKEYEAEKDKILEKN